MDNKTNRILFSLLRSAIVGNKLIEEEIDNLTDNLLYEILTLAKKHDVLHLVVFALKENSIAIPQTFENEIFKAAYRQKIQDSEFDNICAVFEHIKIPFIPLKGTVIRNLYPEPWMRTSCDIDILIEESNIDRAVLELLNIGYKLHGNNFHDISLFSSSGVHLELHHSILENMENIDMVLSSAWKYAVNIDKCKYEFTNEFFIFYLFAHLYYHFVSGGCGIRSLLDIYILKTKIGLSIEDSEYLLKKARIYEFSQKIDNLTNLLFIGDNLDKYQELLLVYILNGGVYGNKNNKATVVRFKKENVFTYSLKRLFLPYKVMKHKHPILKKIPLLLPIFYIYRFLSFFLKKNRKCVKDEINAINSVTKENIYNFKIISEYLDLK